MNKRINKKDKNMGKSDSYWEGVREGQKHSIPSEETLKLIQEMRVDFNARLNSHEEKDRNMREAIEVRPTKEEIQQVVETALDTYFTNRGRLASNFLITIAKIIGALIVVGGGLKLFLSFIGFHYMK